MTQGGVLSYAQVAPQEGPFTGPFSAAWAGVLPGPAGAQYDSPPFGPELTAEGDNALGTGTDPSGQP